VPERVDGRVIALGAVGCYFAALAIVGPETFWRRLGVPHLSPSFLDMHTITAGWECTRRGLAIVPMDSCDPLHRPMNYPRLWMAPAFLGIGQGATVALGIAVVVCFLASVLAVAGPLHPLEGLVYAAALVSPAVMLGIERGNVDLVVFTLLVLALLLFRRSPAGRAVGHGLLLLAAMLKLFPAFAWGPIVRQRPRFAIVGAAGVTLGFVAYAVVTLDDIREIRRVSPQSDTFSYGVGPLADIDRFGSMSKLAFEVGAAVVAVAAAVLLAWISGRLGSPEEVHSADAFCVGAGVYCGSYLFFYNFDYRLIFLLLTLPQLLRATRVRRARLPFPVLGLALVLVCSWLGTSLPPLPAPLDRAWSPRLDELLNWLLFVYLGAGLLLNLVSYAKGKLDSTYSARRAGAAWASK
jgi:hypothetical protein